MKEILIKIQQENIRLDKYLSEYLEDYSRNYIKSLLQSGNILVNEGKVKPSYNVKIDDEVKIYIPDETVNDILPEEKPLNIVYEDEFLAIINKPDNLMVHPTESIKKDTLVNRLLFNFDTLSDIYAPFRPGIVHRLDKDTSGLLIIAKNNKTHEELKEIFKNRKIEKRYLAIVHGRIEKDLIIEKPIGRDEYNRTKMNVVKDGKYAKSIVKPISYNDDYSLVQVQILTGRTHQIRVHLSHLHHPVLGDKVYGFKKEKVNSNRQMLHAFYLKFKHPFTNKNISVLGKLPDDFIQTTIKCNLNLENFNRILVELEDENG